MFVLFSDTSPEVPPPGLTVLQLEGVLGRVNLWSKIKLGLGQVWDRYGCVDTAVDM